MKEKYELYHHGILGMKWGIRRYQNEDGTLTAAGREHYQKKDVKWAHKNYDKIKSNVYKKSRSELNDVVKELNTKIPQRNANGKISLQYAYAYNKAMAEIMTKNASDIKTPYMGEAIKFVASRGQIGVEMIIADSDYDTNTDFKSGVYSNGRRAYTSKYVNMA